MILENAPLDIEPVTVVGLAASPRQGGNSETLLDWFLEGAKQAGGNVRKISLPRLSVSPCLGCHRCSGTGMCIIQDDYQSVRERLFQTDVVALASPAYFWGLPAQAKAFVDRHQSLWAHRALNSESLPWSGRERDRVGVLLGVAGDPVGRFDALTQIVTAFLSAYAIPLSETMWVTGVIERNAIQNQLHVRESAQSLGQSIVDTVLRSANANDQC